MNSKKQKTEWRPACVSPVGTYVRVWVYCEDDDGKYGFHTVSIWSDTTWPPSPWVVAWKPYKFVTITKRELELVEQERLRLQQAVMEGHDR